MSNQVLLPLDMFSKKGSTNALASSQFSDSSKEEDRSQCLSISNEVPYHNPRSNSSSSGVGSGSESGNSINGESETSDYQRSTPSPRDDPFQENSIDSSSNKSKVSLTSKYFEPVLQLYLWYTLLYIVHIIFHIFRLQILRMISVSLKISVTKIIS